MNKFHKLYFFTGAKKEVDKRRSLQHQQQQPIAHSDQLTIPIQLASSPYKKTSQFTKIITIPSPRIPHMMFTLLLHQLPTHLPTYHQHSKNKPILPSSPEFTIISTRTSPEHNVAKRISSADVSAGGDGWKEMR